MSKRKGELKLSFSKLVSTLEKGGYTIELIYCEDGLCRFVECKTPTYQQNFVIFIPFKYDIPFASKKYQRLDLKESGSLPLQKKEFLSELKGDIKADILMKSSLFITAFVKGEFHSYEISVEDRVNSSQPVEVIPSKNEEFDDIDEFDKELDKFTNHEEEKELADVLPRKLKKKEKVKLIFEDTIQDEVKDFVTEELKDDFVEETEDFEESEIVLSGVTYICVDLLTFRKSQDFEKDLVGYTFELDKNGKELRNSGMTQIQELFKKVMDHCKERLDKIELEEKITDVQIFKLTKILTKLKEVRDKTTVKDLLDKSETTREKIKTAIREAHAKNIRLKDDANSLLLLVRTSLANLLEA